MTAQKSTLLCVSESVSRTTHSLCSGLWVRENEAFVALKVSSMHRGETIWRHIMGVRGGALEGQIPGLESRNSGRIISGYGQRRPRRGQAVARLKAIPDLVVNQPAHIASSHIEHGALHSSTVYSVCLTDFRATTQVSPYVQWTVWRDDLTAI